MAPKVIDVCKVTMFLILFISFCLDTEFLCHKPEQFSVVRDLVITIFEVTLMLCRVKG